MTGVSGRFMPADYAAVKATIDAFQKAIFERARIRGDHGSSPAAHRADAVVAMAAAAASTIGASKGTCPGADGRADADPARPGTDTPEGPAGPTAPAGPAGASPSKVDWNAVVLVDAIALARGHVAAGETCRIPGVGDVSLEWVRSILPTSIVDVLVHDGVDITTYASMSRYTPRPIKVAVEVRDDFRCVIAGCTRNRRVERDHRDAFADSFDTSYGNLTSC